MKWKNAEIVAEFLSNFPLLAPQIFIRRSTGKTRI